MCRVKPKVAGIRQKNGPGEADLRWDKILVNPTFEDFTTERA
jgi:hypothetical protein